jgi:HEAT repeat protein
MQNPIPVFRIIVPFLLMFFWISAGIGLAGSAADIEKYTKILQDSAKTSQERSYAAQQLGFAGLDSDAAAHALAGILKNDGDADVRTSAAKSLGMVGLPDTAYIQALIQALDNDNSPAVRSAAAEGLALIGQDSTAAAQALKNAAGNDSNADVRRIAAKVYNQITSTE